MFDSRLRSLPSAQKILQIHIGSRRRSLEEPSKSVPSQTVGFTGTHVALPKVLTAKRLAKLNPVNANHLNHICGTVVNALNSMVFLTSSNVVLETAYAQKKVHEQTRLRTLHTTKKMLASNQRRGLESIHRPL